MIVFCYISCDFYKYGGEFDPGLLFKLFISVSRQLGNKFVYNQVDPSAKSVLIKKSLSMLSQAPLTNPALFYWQRTGGRQGEIDYIIQHGDRVVPVEIKSGAAGRMKSLHQFMADKKFDLVMSISTLIFTDC